MKLNLSVKAYSKILLHSCKYPHMAVNGVVLADKVAGNEVHVSDAIPLFHQCLGLAPMLEIALSQVEAYCRVTKQQMVGYYQANEHIDDNQPDVIAYKIADKIAEYTNNALLFMVDNNKMGAECEELALKVHFCSDGKWKPKDTDWSLDAGESDLAVVSHLITGKAYQSLIDFDNHLDDISQDWLNITINKLVD